jgi:O-acetyl-ADP-ribose deacetylase (regulator of RNase III)
MAGTFVESLDFPNGGRFEVAICDLLAESTDGIVNAANGHLAHGGGVAATIARAAGPALVREGDELVRSMGFVPVGEAVVTTAGRLPFKGVIHAVGPRRGEGDEEARLARALRSALALAHERGWRSLSFPAVSSGIFAVPFEVCARAYLHAVASFFGEQPDSTLKLLRLCVFEGPIVDAVRSEIARVEAGRA